MSHIFHLQIYTFYGNLAPVTGDAISEFYSDLYIKSK